MLHLFRNGGSIFLALSELGVVMFKVLGHWSVCVARRVSGVAIDRTQTHSRVFYCTKKIIVHFFAPKNEKISSAFFVY